MNALYEAVGPEAMRAVPERRPAVPEVSASALSGEDNVVRTLQILYGRGDLIVSPSARDTLESWAETFVSPTDRIAILSYSGHRPESWSEPSLHPGQEIATYSLHESIRTCFKRALVVRDVLIAEGVSEDRIVLRALGPSEDGGPAERIDVSLISATP